MTTNLQADLAAIRKLLEERMVKCSNKAFHLGDPQCVLPIGVCPDCKGALRIPDPQYDGLRKVWQGPCPCIERASCSKCCLMGVHVSWCTRCEGTSTVLRSWNDQPEGALAGALEDGMPAEYALAVVYYRLGDETQADIWREDDIGERLVSVKLRGKHRDAAAAQAVREFLEKERP